MANPLPEYLRSTSRNYPAKGHRINLSFLDKTILNTARSVRLIYLQAENAARQNFLSRINPNVKFISLVYMAVIISLVRNLHSQMFLSAFIFILYLLAAGTGIFSVLRKIVLVAFVFGFLIVFPASLNVITPGKMLATLITLREPVHFWIYTIPATIGFTDSGLQVVSMIFLRVLNSVSFALLVVFTTPFSSLIKSFRIIRVPDTFLMIISLAYKYIFILSRTIEETYFALKSRLSGNIKSSQIRSLVSGRIFFIFKKSAVIYESTYFAMVSRGYTGKVKLHTDNIFTFPDLVCLLVIATTGIIIILL